MLNLVFLVKFHETFSVTFRRKEKMSFEAMDSASKQQRKLIPRGAQPSAITRQKLSSLTRNEGKLAVTASEQCDSGFVDDEELRSRSMEVCSETQMRSVEECTQNLTIDDPETNTRHPSSSYSSKEGFSQSEELYLNYAQRNDVRYLLAQEHFRRLMFMPDEDGDT